MIKRLHPDLKLTRILTGRLATSGYPLLGLPKRSAVGKRIRGLVKAPSDWQIVSVDYSQIELRVAAELSQDAGMIAAFKAGRDIHQETGEKIWGAAHDRQKHRTAAKAGNFGYWMGLSEKGLTEQIHKEGMLTWSASCKGCKSFKAPHAENCDSARFFRQYDQEFPGAARYREERRTFALEFGKAFGIWGESWSLPGAFSPHEDVREQALRQSHALPIQSGAQRLIKQAMAKVHAALPADGSVEPLLQIHDELLFCVQAGFVRDWCKTTKRLMEGVVQWSIPIIAEPSVGDSWLHQEAI